MSSNLRIGVIGAGIVGLSTANFLQESFHSAKITLLAEHFLTETTSDGAAGLFLPSSVLGAPTPEQSLKWFHDAYEFYQEILTNNAEEAHLAGVRRIGGYLLSSEDPDLPLRPETKMVVSSFRECSSEELTRFPNAKYGSYCDTVLTECRRYLPYMTEKFKSKGGIVIKWRINSFEELVPDFDIVFNCSGLGAKKLCADPRMAPVRGQVLKVEAPWLDHFTYIDYDTYIIPGIEAVTLGGVRNFNSYKQEIDKFDSAGIMERCTNLVPSLKHAKILREWVGFRPYRGIVRVEPEVINFYGGKSLKVVHNYGHGGHGVMSAPGTSKNAVEIGVQLLRSNTKAKL